MPTSNLVGLGTGHEMPEHKRSGDNQVGSKWVIIVTLAVVVAAFLGGSGYAEYRARRMHDLTAEIANNESPSILYLAAARAELRDLQRLLTTHVLLASTGQPAPTQPLKEVRDRLRENLQAYFALPALPDERELWQRIDKELTDVDVLAGKIMQATAGGRYPAAQKLLVDELPDAIDDEADAIMADIRLNAARVREVAEQIDSERRRRTLWVFGLDGVSVALAIALAVLALRTLSGNEEIVRRRSEELEGFAGRVAHDLLNPISAAEMSLAATERGAAGNERMATLAARGRRSLSRARRLIDDLFAFAQAGARPVPGVTAAVAEIVDGVVEEQRVPALERGITIAVTPPPAPVAVRCASGVLASLLSNLLRNAIKHMGNSKRRQIEVRIEPRHDRVRFEVEDTGPGLPPELMPQAFDPYVRGTGTSEPGLGLGLATVRRLVEGHYGRYGVTSTPGEGALFWFELPAADDPPPREIPPPESFERHHPLA
jgi:signal transduction histidine kinase